MEIYLSGVRFINPKPFVLMYIMKGIYVAMNVQLI